MKIRTDAIPVFKFLGYSNDSSFQQLEIILRFKFRQCSIQLLLTYFDFLTWMSSLHCVVLV